MNKAFIFTLDAALALIPIFIITASISQISGVDSVGSYGSMVSSERTAQGVLEIMSVTKKTDEMNLTALNTTLEELIPSYYNYSYLLEYANGSDVNITRGNFSEASNVIVARRLDYIKPYMLLATISNVTELGAPFSEDENCGSSPPLYYEIYMDIGTNELSLFDYWLLGSTSSTGIQVDYNVSGSDIGCSSLQDSTVTTWVSFMNTSDSLERVDMTSMLKEGANYLYLNVSANSGKTGSFYMIRAPAGTADNLITYENAVKRDFAWITLKVWK